MHGRCEFNSSKTTPQIFIHSQLCINSKHIYLQSINTPYSWLFVITKICNQEYNVRNHKTNLQFIFMIFNTTTDSYIKLNMEINGKVCTCLLKTSTKLQQKSMFYESVIKRQIKFVIFNIRIYSFFTKYLHIYFYSKNVCLWMSATFPKLPFLLIPNSPSTWTTK